MSQDMSQDMSQEGEEKAQTKKFTLVITKRFLMNNPGNEAWIKSQEKVHEATLVSQARSKLLRNSMYPELSVVLDPSQARTWTEPGFEVPDYD
jgi:hypothetical protein